MLDPRRVADTIAAPQTVKEFSHIWDSLRGGATSHEVVWATGAAFARAVPSRRQHDFLPVQLEPSKTATEADVREVHLGLQCLVPSSVDGIKKLDQDVPTSYQLHGTISAGRRYNLYFPIEQVEPKGVDGQALLFRGKADVWHRGYFKNSFRELNALLQGTANLTWEEAGERVADDEVHAPAESFDALGMKFPARVSLDWAVLVLLCVQWYLWAQLYEFRRRLQEQDEGWDVAWIGMYCSFPARALLMISALALPVMASLSIGVRRLYLPQAVWLSRTELVLGVVLSLALARAIFGVAVANSETADRLDSRSSCSSARPSHSSLPVSVNEHDTSS